MNEQTERVMGELTAMRADLRVHDAKMEAAARAMEVHNDRMEKAVQRVAEAVSALIESMNQQDAARALLPPPVLDVNKLVFILLAAVILNGLGAEGFRLLSQVFFHQ